MLIWPLIEKKKVKDSVNRSLKKRQYTKTIWNLRIVKNESTYLTDYLKDVNENVFDIQGTTDLLCFNTPFPP